MADVARHPFCGTGSYPVSRGVGYKDVSGMLPAPDKVEALTVYGEFQEKTGTLAPNTTVPFVG